MWYIPVESSWTEHEQEQQVDSIAGGNLHSNSANLCGHLKTSFVHNIPYTFHIIVRMLKTSTCETGDSLRSSFTEWQHTDRVYFDTFCGVPVEWLRKHNYQTTSTFFDFHSNDIPSKILQTIDKINIKMIKIQSQGHAYLSPHILVCNKIHLKHLTIFSVLFFGSKWTRKWAENKLHFCTQSTELMYAAATFHATENSFKKGASNERIYESNLFAVDTNTFGRTLEKWTCCYTCKHVYT